MGSSFGQKPLAPYCLKIETAIVSFSLSCSRLWTQWECRTASCAAAANKMPVWFVLDQYNCSQPIVNRQQLLQISSSSITILHGIITSKSYLQSIWNALGGCIWSTCPPGPTGASHVKKHVKFRQVLSATVQQFHGLKCLKLSSPQIGKIDIQF